MSRFTEAMMAPLPMNATGTAHVHHQFSSQRGDERAQEEEEEQGDGMLPISFAEEDLRRGVLRGTPVHEIVAGAGKHWEANSQQSEQAKSWAFSEPVRRNSAFISHSWKASRWLKWLALLAFFNGRLSAIAALLAAAAAALVDYWLPIQCLRANFQGSDFSVTTTTSFPFYAGTFVGVCFFFAGHHFRRLFEIAQLLEIRSTFLDKLVIHQDDPDLKQKGISLLGAFICTSDVFLVLWSKEYLSRLWCSYEVAVFAHLSRAADFQGRLCFWPLPLVKIVVAKVTKAVLLSILTIVVYNGVEFSMLYFLLFPVAFSVPTAVSTAGMVELFHEVSAMEHQICTYDLRATECFNPADREGVEASVTAWFAPTNRDQAIDRFNGFVQTELRGSIGQSFDDRGRIHYAVAMWVTLPYVFVNTMGSVGTAVQLAPYHYAAWVFSCLMQDIASNMLVMFFQNNAVRLIERRCQGVVDYASLPAQGSAGTQMNPERYSRKAFVLQVVVCSAIDCSTNMGLYLLSQQLPPSWEVFLCAGVVLLTMYIYK